MSDQIIPDFLKGEYPFSSQFLTLPDDYRLHYIDEGEGPVVIMLHGNPTWSFYYRRVVKELVAKGFRCIVPDHIGCGLSDKPSEYPYTLKRHIDNVRLLINELNIEKFSLIVHDWGGAIGMGVATEKPDTIDKIVILNTAAFLSKRIPFRIRICKTPILGEFITKAFNAFALPATWMAVAKPLATHIKKGYLLPYNSWKNRIATWRFVKDIPLSSTHISYSRLEKIDNNLHKLLHKPIKVFWGGQDFCFNDHFYKEWVARYPKAETEYYPEAGHYILEDKTGEIEGKIGDFLLS
jgi:haloalkane dehalogenase